MNTKTRWTYKVIRFKPSTFFKLRNPDPDEVADQLNQLGHEVGVGARSRRLRCNLARVLSQTAGLTPHPQAEKLPCIAN